MSRLLTIACVCFVVLVAATSTHALEKTSARLTDELDSSWGASSTITVLYYNICTGWVWVWNGWSPGEMVGVCFNSPCFGFGSVNVTWALTFSGAPSGYGFTGTIALCDGCACNVPELLQQPYLPPAGTGWNATSWGGFPVPDPFMIFITWQAPAGFTNPTGLASDHPAAGPTGPQACGTCFPSTRSARTLYFGVNEAYCPAGIGLSDGVCDAEFLIDAGMKCVISVEDESWGQIKALYR